MRRRLRRSGIIAAICGVSSLWMLSDRLFQPEMIAATAAHVRDGDTFSIGEKMIRLYGIDAPEYQQTCKNAAGRDWPCGRSARAQLAALVLMGPISCETLATDKYARRVARCSAGTVPDLSAAMVAAGFAISPAERGIGRYADEQRAARDAGRGLWQGQFDTPSTWRNTHPR